VQQVLEIKNYKKDIKRVTTAWEIEYLSGSEHSNDEEPAPAQQQFHSERADHSHDGSISDQV
jgi:hypothetical protein